MLQGPARGLERGRGKMGLGILLGTERLDFLAQAGGLWAHISAKFHLYSRE